MSIDLATLSRNATNILTADLETGTLGEGDPKTQIGKAWRYINRAFIITGEPHLFGYQLQHNLGYMNYVMLQKDAEILKGLHQSLVYISRGSSPTGENMKWLDHYKYAIKIILTPDDSPHKVQLTKTQRRNLQDVVVPALERLKLQVNEYLSQPTKGSRERF